MLPMAPSLSGLLLCACTAGGGPSPSDTLESIHHGDTGSPLGSPEDSSPETSWEWEAPTELVAGPQQDPADIIYSDTLVHDFQIVLNESSVQLLNEDWEQYVPGTFTYDGREYSPVGVRLKGSSSWNWLDAKPAWKIKFNEYVEGGRFYGLKRLTLNNNVWDPSMMAETLAYRVFRQADSPAPRTGYATVTFNGYLLGLYTIVESMDDVFVEHWWPGSQGGLYEMTRNCDFNGDCDCFELEDAGDNMDPDALARVCDAVGEGTVGALETVFDWDNLMAFFAAERVTNHPDSYSFNLNNFHIYHDPLEDKLSLIPWGADSTFVYHWPAWELDYECDVMSYYDDLAEYPYAYLAQFCQGNEECWADLSAAMLEVADLLEDMDLAGFVESTRENISSFVYSETRIPYLTPEHFDQRVDCHEEWILQRPDEVRAYLQ